MGYNHVVAGLGLAHSIVGWVELASANLNCHTTFWEKWEHYHGDEINRVCHECKQ